MVTPLEAVNEVLLLVGERRVSTRASSPPSDKAESSIVSALREFSLLNDWPFLAEWVSATAWNGSVASFDADVIRITRVKNADGKEMQYVGEEMRPYLPAFSWRLDGFNQVLVPDAYAATAVTFKVIKHALLPATETDISLPSLAIEAVIKRSVAYMNVRHLDDAGIAAQYSAEYEVLVQELRSKYGKEPNGYWSMYRRARY